MRVSTTFHFWVNPPSTQLPVRRREIRFAVGVPNGASTNSWKLWVRRDEAYLACRDNFREFKLSLHASGIWRLAFTSEAVTRNSALQTPDGDRLIRRWTPDLTSGAVIAFELVVSSASLYLQPDQRRDWPSDVIFAELLKPERLTVVALTIVKGHQALTFSDSQPGSVLGIAPMSDGRSAQLVLTGYDREPFRAVVEQAMDSVSARLGLLETAPEGVTLFFGARPDASSWIVSFPNSRLIDAARQGARQRVPDGG